jgi:hypothetical protein
MTGDRMKMLMLTIPFMVRGLVAPEVKLINAAMDNAKSGSRLHELPHVSGPSNDVVEVLIQCMDWNIAACQSLIPKAELPALQQKAVDLLDTMQRNAGTCRIRHTGEKAKWNFEKSHSILHKVREIILWGNSDNTCCEAPEVCTYRSTDKYLCVHTYKYLCMHC